jgi:hypothetical protein
MYEELGSRDITKPEPLKQAQADFCLISQLIKELPNRKQQLGMVGQACLSILSVKHPDYSILT